MAARYVIDQGKRPDQACWRRHQQRRAQTAGIGERARSTDKTVKLDAGAFHDLLAEPEGPEVAALDLGP